MRLLNCRGQALLEWVISIIPIWVCVSGIGILLICEYRRMSCAYEVFESAHRHMMKYPENMKMSARRVHVYEAQDRIVGVQKCGSTEEKVELPLLESAKWD